MTLLLFVLLLVMSLLVMKRYQNAALFLFFCTLAIAFYWFLHHVTDPLSIQL
jgi:hypothetical protein